MNRYFRMTPVVYGQFASELDSLFGFPKPGTQRSLPQEGRMPRDPAGRILLLLDQPMLGSGTVASALNPRVDDGSAEEITEAEYVAALPTLPTP